MRKVNKKAQAIQQRKRRKRLTKSKENQQIRREKLSHRQNVIMAKKQELFEKYLAAVNTHFKEDES